MGNVVNWTGKRHSDAIRVKDTVVLKSGGPQMIVMSTSQRASDGRWCAECIWLSIDGVIQRTEFPFGGLVVVHRFGDEWVSP